MISTLFEKYNCDKSWAHHYGHVYDLILNAVYNIVGHNLKVLELGTTATGYKSSYAFSEHRFIDKYVGVDIIHDASLMPKNPKCVFIEGDAYESSTIEKCKEHAPFDILIDDGPHGVSDQIAFFRDYAILRNSYAVMICEDVRTEHCDHICSAIKDLSPIVVDTRPIKQLDDPNLVIAYNW